MKVNQDNVPFEFQFETRLTKVTMTLHYSLFPNPVSGDLRRMTAVDGSQITGTNITNARIDLDYQDVEGFHVPHHASFSVGGVFAVPVEFTGCSIATAGR